MRHTPLQFGKGVLFYIQMEKFQSIPISHISVNPYQPRETFDENKLTELAQSIKQHGVIQPIIVRQSSLIGYELLAGERRLRAASLAGLTEIPAIVKHLTDEEMMVQAVIENLQRDNLNPIEEAQAYQALHDRGLRHEEIAQQMGKSRPYVSNLIRLLQLSPLLQESVVTERISQAHARLLVSFNPEEQELWLQRIEKENLSVRSLENLLRETAKTTKNKKSKPKDAFLLENEKELKKKLGLSVKINTHSPTGQKGSVQIYFNNLDEYQKIINSLK